MANDEIRMLKEKVIKGLDEARRRASIKRKEIEKLRSAMESTKIEIKETITEDVVEEPIVVKEESNDFEEEIEYYLSELSKVSNDEISEILPSKNNYHYENIMLRLIAEITKDINDIREIIDTTSMSKEEFIEYKDEIISLGKRRNIIKNSLLAEEKEELEVKENKLVFMPIKGSNKIRVLDEVKDIPQEEYEGFIELFNSIKDGTFKNIKRFVNNDVLKGALEVKGFQIRVLFQRLSKDCYAVISMFIKKTQNDRGYRQQLAYKYTEYKELEKEYKEKIKDEKFLEENKKYEAELFEILGKNKGVNK